MHANQSQISLKLWQNNWVESKNKSAELMFPIWLWILNFGFVFFQSHPLFTILHRACYHIFGSLAIGNSTFFKKLKLIFILKLKTRFKCKESKSVHPPHGNEFWCLQCKWYGLKRKVKTKLLDLIKFNLFLFSRAFPADTLNDYFRPLELYFENYRPGEKYVVVLFQ